MNTNTSKEIQQSIFDKTITLVSNYTNEKTEIVLKQDGEKVTAVKINGKMDVIEDVAENLEQQTWIRGLYFLKEKMIPYPHHTQLIYVQTLEKIMGYTSIVPKKAIYFRTIYAEIERIISHLLYLAQIVKAISFPLLLSRVLHKYSYYLRITI